LKSREFNYNTLTCILTHQFIFLAISLDAAADLLTFPLSAPLEILTFSIEVALLNLADLYTLF
jgi:hypothetical protein